MICLKIKTIPALLACALLCSCSGDTSASIQSETNASLITSAATSAETNPTEEIPTDNVSYVDENGLLTDSGMRRINEIVTAAEGNDRPSGRIDTGLFVFDGDNLL